MKFLLIEAEKARHSVSLLARVLGVSREGYYQWARRGESPRAAEDRALTEKSRRCTRGRGGPTGHPACTPNSPTIMVCG
jgi:putative transposase